MKLANGLQRNRLSRGVNAFLNFILLTKSHKLYFGFNFEMHILKNENKRVLKSIR